MFAIDSFDHALNPRLAKKVMEVFSQLILDSGKTVFLTTHNPLVLDGLDIGNDQIRLFTVGRNKAGPAELNRNSGFRRITGIRPAFITFVD